MKLTNTFPVEIVQEELPGEEMYMSGRALFPLTITVADRIAQATAGQLPISYSGGADAHNIAALARLGIAPVTLATTLLKPGGYDRITQLARRLADEAVAIPKDAGGIEAHLYALERQRESIGAVNLRAGEEAGEHGVHGM